MLCNFELFGILVAKDQAQKETQLVEKAKGATMSAFRVTSIIYEDAFRGIIRLKMERWNRTRVRPAGYNARGLHTTKGQKSKDTLSKLIHRQQVELRTTYKVD